VGISGVVENKSGNLSETCEEMKSIWRAYRNSPTLFRTVPSPTPYGLPTPTLGVRNPNPKLQLLLSQERVKLLTANLADTFTGSIRTQAHEKFGTAWVGWKKVACWSTKVEFSETCKDKGKVTIEGL